MIPIYYILIILAIGIAIVAEVFVEYQKYQMKRQFVEELDKKDQEQERTNNDDHQQHDQL